MLSENTIRIVKSTVPLLANAGVAVTNHFYERMFSHNPELKDIFNMSNQQSGRQQFALFGAIAAYAKHIDNLAELSTLVERVANKHTSFFIQPEHYPIVGQHLLATLQELAPDAFTEEVTAAWAEAYGFLADILIGRENQLYQDKQTAVGGWLGPRVFRVANKRYESELVASFLLEPKDGNPVVDYLPGQYLGIKLKPTGEGPIEIRQYSLSDKANGRSYRISVKREQSPLPGRVSNYLHQFVNEGDELELLPPAGNFYLQSTEVPTVLISGGVGITPMMAMLETLCATEAPPPVWFLHATEHAGQHSFVERVDSLADSVRALKVYYWHRQQQSHSNTVFCGLIDLQRLSDELPLAAGQFYICGPIDFMKTVKGQLLAMDVPVEHIHYEVFGPHSDI